MWKPTTKWKPARKSGSAPLPVEENGSGCTGLAKQRGVMQEKLASDFARLISVSVPEIVLDEVEGKQGIYAISRAFGDVSHDVTSLKGTLGKDFESAAIRSALRAASGLIPFYAWIDTTDQKDAHLVVAERQDGTYDVAGVDFEMSFRWTDANAGIVPATAVPPALSSNIDKAQIAATVTDIEAVSDQDITGTVNALPDEICSVDDKRRIVAGLIIRKSKVRGAMQGKGWLD